MLCSKCGAANPPEARFCGKCGTPVAKGPPAIPVAPVKENPSAQPAPQKKAGLAPVLIVAGAAVMVLGIIVVFAIVHFSNASKPDLTESSDPSYANSTPPPVGVPPSPSKFNDYNNTANAAPNAGRPVQLAETGDAFYARKIVGTWRARKFILGAVVDIKCVYMAGGRASWSGTLTYMGRQTFLMYSGTWSVENGMLHTYVESSNVPQLIPVGTTGGSKFVSVTDEEWVYVDLLDGQTGTAFRLADNGY